ncbi:MAG: DUF262 domain-containing protein [Methanobrevibacter sp.]|jgi:hypothetical protein|nr:DUF262 domain-containing protein [Candidatus Methanovirga procula]
MESIEKKINETRNSLKTERLDMTFGEVIRMYEEKEIIIDPEYQRLFRWDSTKQTKFIESLLLGIPIPPIFVVEQKGTWELVDGLQRISTVLSFCGFLEYNNEKNIDSNSSQKNNWKLEKGDLIEDIENLTYNEMSKELQFIIKRYVCRVEVIKSNSEYDMRYELFNRLNTGGAILTNQEIRNCIFRAVSPDFNDFINEEGRKRGFIDLIDLPARKKDEMFLEELVLRFCSLYNNADNIQHSITQHMTEFMKNTVGGDEKIAELKEVWRKTINLLETQDREIFRARRGVFSTVLYDGITVGLAQNIYNYIDNPEKLTEKIEELKNNQEFKKGIGKLHSKDNLKRRLKLSDKIFKD